MLRSILLCLLILVGTSEASAAVVTFNVGFNELQHGEVITNQYQDLGLTVSALTNRKGNDGMAIGFDSGLSEAKKDNVPRDDFDLLEPWDGGNLVDKGLSSDQRGVLQQGVMAIIAENEIDNDNDGLIDTPDDEAKRPAGYLNFEFDEPILSFGIDLMDIEEFGNTKEKGSIEFFGTDADGNEVSKYVLFEEFTDPGSEFYAANNSPYTPGDFEFENNYANRVAPITAEAMGMTSFYQVRINLGGSGAVDNLVWTKAEAVPEPASLLAWAGLVTAAGWRYRRKRRQATA